MPNVVFEAGALNIPILASKAGGIPDILNDSNAFIFDVLSEKSLLEALSQFENSTKQDLKLKTQGLKDQLEHYFTPKQETQNYLNIFNQLKV